MSSSANSTSPSPAGESDGEVTRDEAMQLLLKSPEIFSDITLDGSDGATVFANRCLLAARSRVFTKMLYGDFAEASSKVVQLPYTGRVLESLVSYIYTDSAKLLVDDDTELTSKKGFASELAALADAATYFELPSLCRKALAVARSVIEDNPKVAAEFLSASEAFASLANSETEQFAFEQLVANLEDLLDDEKDAIALMSSDRISAILQNQDLAVDELTLFKVLDAWSQVQEESNGNDVDRPDRKGKAAELTSLLILPNIEPDDLNAIVAPSGLVSNEQLLEAYKTQALNAKSGWFPYCTSRGAVWRSSGGVLFSCKSFDLGVEFLNCPELRTGIHKWSMKIENLCNSAWVGVASTKHDINPNKFLGCQKGGWVYGETGTALAYNFASFNGPRLEKGSVVTTLNLTNSGTLHASVDGSRPFELFDKMLANFRGCDNVGFVPAVSLKAPGAVRFLGFSTKAGAGV